MTGKIARLHARDSFRGPTDGNVAYRGLASALCRSIRLGRNGALGGAGLRQLASGGAETRCHFFVRIMAKRARSIFLARNTDYRQRSPAIKIIFTGDPVITPAKS